MSGHARGTDFPLALGTLGKFVPLRILQPAHVVDRMVEVDIHVIRAQSLQASLQCGHERFFAFGSTGTDLRRDVDLVALAEQGVANGSLRITSGVALCRVEVIDAAIEGVSHEIFFPRTQAASAERDVGHLDPGVAESDIAAYLSSGLC